MIDRAQVLAQYDREIRRDPPPYEGVRVERAGPVVRVVGRDNFVIYSELTSENARRVVAEQARFFRALGHEAEWKLFGHDTPDDLERILAAEGFVPDEPETLLVFDLRQGTPGTPPAPGIEVRRVTEERELPDVAAANLAAFGPSEPTPPEKYVTMFHDPSQTLYVAYAGGEPVASGRLDTPAGRSFAGIYGGGTAPAHRHHGVYRALVHARAELARDRGYRYLVVDARETSRPILERLGFEPLTSTRPWVLRPAAGPSP